MDRLLQLYHDASNSLNEVLADASRSARGAVSSATVRVDAARAAGIKITEDVQESVKRGSELWMLYEDKALEEAKRSILLVQEHPAAAYTVLAVGSVFLLPSARRAFLRLVLPWQNDEAVAKSAQQEISRLTLAVENSSKSIQELEAKMVMAEEELKRGQDKLKLTRGEMQRVLGAVCKGEKAAHSMMEKLRRVKSAPNVLQLRAEAASKHATLKQQRLMLQKYIYRISSNDV